MNKGILIAPLAALLLAACGGDDDDNDTAGSLVVTRTLAEGDATCAGGGTVAETGVDANGNGVLEASEVTNSEYLQCLTAPRLRALHASPDAPPVNVRVNGAQALANVDYGQGSGFLDAAESSRVEVEAIIPGGNAVVLDRTLAQRLHQRVDGFRVVVVGADVVDAGPDEGADADDDDEAENREGDDESFHGAPQNQMRTPATHCRSWAA